MRKEATVGLRLQDVIIRAKTKNRVILDLRRSAMVRLRRYPSETERMVILNVVCRLFFKSNLNKIIKNARRVLIPSCDCLKKKRLFMGSATSSSDCQEMENDIFINKNYIINIPGAIEGRDIWKMTSGDIVLINTKDGLSTARSSGVKNLINIAEENILTLTGGDILSGSDIYYKADSVLLLMIINPKSIVLKQLLNEIIKNPLIDLYSLDDETQIMLVWLMKTAKISSLKVNANSPGVAEQLNRKGYKYPKIEDALVVNYNKDPYVMQKKEWKMSLSSSEINYHPDFVPGYLITHHNSYEELYKKILTSMMLLSIRYQLTVGYIKTDRGVYGGRQGSIKLGLLKKLDEEEIKYYLEKGFIQKALDLYKKNIRNISDVTSWAKEMWRIGGSWIIEASTYYFKIEFPYGKRKKMLIMAMSAHLINGRVRDTVTLQIMDGTVWGGNLICSKRTWEKLIMIINTDSRIILEPRLINQIKGSYTLMIKALNNYVKAINNSKKYRNGQIRGGADLSVVTLGGKFGINKIVIAVQDYNARSNGGETAYALYDQAKRVYGRMGEAVTRNVVPNVSFEFFLLKIPEIVKKVNYVFGKAILIEQVKLITVSKGWGQFGVIGTDALEIMEDIFIIEDQLKKENIIQ